MSPPPPIAPSRTRELRPGLHVLETRVDDFAVRSAVVVGSSAALVWDTLAHPDQMRPAAGLLAGRPAVVAYSHADWDHVWGTGALEGHPPVVAQERCGARFLREVPEELARRCRAEPGRWDAVELVPPGELFATSTELDLGGVRVRLEHLPGHTDDCAVAWLPDQGVLLAGDTVETPLPFVNHGGAVPAWIAGLRRWAAEPALELVVPAHGPVGGRPLVEATVRYLEALLAGAAAAPDDSEDAFYRRTHRDNVRRVEEARGQG